jgi:molybdenum cofactor synthesis domain-containing protein
MTATSSKTAGIIIIGNEILSGKVRDTNSSFLASALRTLGVNLKHISVIPDDVETIGSEALDFSKTYDYVFTTGGVGPTHDDVTMEGIAEGFQVKIIQHPELVAYFHLHYHDRLNAAVMKMTEVPEGAEIIDVGDRGLPIVAFKNIFIFPGIPQYLTEKFKAIQERFRAPAFHLRRLFLNAHESDIAEILNTIVAANIDVTFGSYPIIENAEYKIILTAESRSHDLLDRAFHELLKRLPKDILVRVE